MRTNVSQLVFLTLFSQVRERDREVVEIWMLLGPIAMEWHRMALPFLVQSV